MSNKQNTTYGRRLVYDRALLISTMCATLDERELILAPFGVDRQFRAATLVLGGDTELRERQAAMVRARNVRQARCPGAKGHGQVHCRQCGHGPAAGTDVTLRRKALKDVLFASLRVSGLRPAFAQELKRPSREELVFLGLEALDSEDPFVKFSGDKDGFAVVGDLLLWLRPCAKSLTVARRLAESEWQVWPRSREGTPMKQPSGLNDQGARYWQV